MLTFEGSFVYYLPYSNNLEELNTVVVIFKFAMGCMHSPERDGERVREGK